MNVCLLEEKQIKSILSVYRNGSFENAADELSYTESAISKHISTAERYLGIRLFERRGRTKVFLTADGEMLLPYIEEIHNGYQRLEQFIIKNTSIHEPVLTLSASNVQLKCSFTAILTLV
jgi:DNA-binding transcriptional LysR family regulator